MARLKNKMISSEVQKDYINSIYLGNIYGLHDGYDGSVFSPLGICKTITASVGGIADVLIKVEQRAESREQRIVAAIDLSVNHPSVILIANCITARENRGISKIRSIGNGVVMETIKESSKLM